MHPFATYILRNYYRATGWNEDNLYANLTRSSNGPSTFGEVNYQRANRYLLSDLGLQCA